MTDGLLRIADISRRESLIGISRLAPLPLDRSIGFRLAFQLQATLEDHGNRPDRSGISLTVIGNDRKGIELGFWDFSTWAQSDSPLFVHSEEAAWFTHSHLAYYVLTIQGNTYSLTADGMALLTGPLRDYTSFVGPLDPYETPNFLFFGDNTTSARGSFVLGTVEILPITSPELSVALEGAEVRIGWPVSLSSWHLESSAEPGFPADWRTVDATVLSGNDQNEVRLPVDGERQFFRLRR